MKLRDLLATVTATIERSGSGSPGGSGNSGGLTFAEHPALDQDVKRLCTNSQACEPGDLFVGLPGTRVDGGDFWAGAIASGAVAALISDAAADRGRATADGAAACLIGAADIVGVCAIAAAIVNDYPVQKLNLVGITGTNGKTTTSQLIEYVLAAGGAKPALFGTLVVRWPGFEETATHTTPFAVDLQARFAEAVAAGATHAVMEVSSHALAQRRVEGCAFEVAVFTNLTQDHLDFHGTMEAYFAAKALLFSEAYLAGRAIINHDDPYGQRLVEQLRAAGQGDRVWSYSVTDSAADLYMSDLTYYLDGVAGQVHTPAGTVAVRSPLVGQFNLQNLLAAIGAALHLGVDLATIASSIGQFPGVPGRMERVRLAKPTDSDPTQDVSVIVDYAHTPDSLANALRAARPFVERELICVFGCGGDRDRTKRPIMGQIGADLADWAIVTSDNPRTEDPDRILADVVAGIPAEARFDVIGDRAAAIRTAILQAQAGDCILIAGKGHEDYQILGTEKVHFDDREQAQAALVERLRLAVD